MYGINLLFIIAHSHFKSDKLVECYEYFLSDDLIPNTFLYLFLCAYRVHGYSIVTKKTCIVRGFFRKFRGQIDGLYLFLSK